MGLFDFFRKKEEVKVDATNGQEVVDFTNQVEPTPTEHSNIIEDGHDVFAKAKNETETSEEIVIDEKQEDIVPTTVEEQKEDIVLTPVEEEKSLSSINNTPEEEKPREISANDMAVFKECLLAEVKRKKGTGELSDASVHDFCHERMKGFTDGSFNYPEEVRNAMRKHLENQDIINELNGKPRVLQSEEESVKKVA